jgi:hypothetical protein
MGGFDLARALALPALVAVFFELGWNVDSRHSLSMLGCLG